MKSFKALLAFILICVVHIGYAQKAVSQAAIKDFSSSCEFQSKYNQNQNFMLVTLMQHIAVKTGSSMMKADVIINSTGIDKEARETVFEAFNSISGGDPDKLFLYLNNWGLTPAYAKEISIYIGKKYIAPIVTEIEPSKPEDKLEGYDFTSLVSVDSTETFFQGTKKFEGHIDDVYKVTVTGNKIEILELNNYSAVSFSGTIKNGRILDKSNKEGKYRYRDGKLYYHGSKNQWWIFYELSN